MLETIGIVQKKADNPAEKLLTPSVSKGFLIDTRKKLTQANPTCLGFEQGFVNPFASESLANGFYDPATQTLLQNENETNSGWHATWIPALEKPVISIFDKESLQILKNNPAIPWYGDPTETIAAVLNEIKSAIGDDVDELLKLYRDDILVRLGELIPILTKFLVSTKEGFKDLIDFIMSIFEPEGKETVKLIKKSMKDSKDAIKAKVLEIIAPFSIPAIPEIPDLSIQGIIEFLGIEFPEPIDVNLQIPTLLFPGIPGLSPPGFAMLIFKVITLFVEELIRISMGAAQIFSIDELLAYILSADLPGLIGYLFESFSSYFIAKLREEIPGFDNMIVFVCSLFAYLEKMIQIFVLVTIGHLIGPGLILQSVADLMGVI